MKGSVFSYEKAYVVFADNVSLWWLRLLKPGFRHCYLLFSCCGERFWIEVNPYSNQTIIRLYEFDKPTKADSLVVGQEKVKICEVFVEDAPQKCAPLGFFSCVEMVKRVLGIHDVRIITPYRLYKKIKIVGKKS